MSLGNFDKRDWLFYSGVGLVLGGLYLSFFSEKKENGVCPMRNMQSLKIGLMERFGASANGGPPSLPNVDPPVLVERGAADLEGKRQESSERLYMQLVVLDVQGGLCEDFEKSLKSRLLEENLSFVIYKDVNSHCGIGLLTWFKEPVNFTLKVRKVLNELDGKFSTVIRKGWTMLGKSYSNGHEKDLRHFLFEKNINAVTHKDRNYAIWYPMRRKPSFYNVDPSAQCEMLLVHASIGRSYAEVDAAHDVRLNCFGIDENDNEFLVGLIGKDLANLSKVVQDMRKTEHTSKFLEKLGPFFVGFRSSYNLAN